MNWKSNLIRSRRALLAASALVSISAGSALAGNHTTPEIMTTDMLSIQGSWLNFQPSTSARRYALECVDCSDTDNIAGANFVLSHESDFQDMSGTLKYYNVLNSSNDMAFGLTGGMFETEIHRLIPLYQQDGNIGTPYGTVDSSSTNVGGTNQDKAKFLTGDFEYGWRETGKSNGSGFDQLNRRFFVGARAQFLNWKRTAAQDLSSSNVYAGEEKSEFYGIGPRVGGSFDYPLGTTKRLGLFGSLSGGAMLGRRKQSFSLDSSSTAFEDLHGDSSTIVAPFVDADIGISAYLNEGVTIQFGYQVGFEANVLRTATVCTDDYDDDVAPYNESCGTSSGDVLTHGAVIRLTGTF